MKVRELVDLLMAQSPEEHVLFHLAGDEKAFLSDCDGIVSSADLASGKEPYPYCGGYSVEEFAEDEPDLDFIVIKAN